MTVNGRRKEAKMQSDMCQAAVSSESHTLFLSSCVLMGTRAMGSYNRGWKHTCNVHADTHCPRKSGFMEGKIKTHWMVVIMKSEIPLTSLLSSFLKVLFFTKVIVIHTVLGLSALPVKHKLCFFSYPFSNITHLIH